MEWASHRRHLNHMWSGAVVCLTVPTESDLYHYLLETEDLEPISFYEPDIGDQLSAFAVLLTQEQSKMLSHLPLAGSHAIDLPVKGGE